MRARWRAFQLSTASNTYGLQYEGGSGCLRKFPLAKDIIDVPRRVTGLAMDCGESKTAQGYRPVAQ